MQGPLLLPNDLCFTTTMTLTGQSIRDKFIRFFTEQLGKEHAHTHLPSASLVPSNPTVLLTPAGMLPFVPIFLGIEPAPKPPRAVTVQKCARVSGKASDLENVGRTPRHHTFFEMLGNFSFGDYFKKEIIPWSWRLVTEEFQLPKDRLWITVYKDDEESREIWHKTCGIPYERILYKDEKDNFWGPPGPTGPCGPCSEIHYDHLGPSKEYPGDPASNPDVLDTDRFVEIWNLVFMELFKDADGKFSPLEKKNVDTGMGLERIVMVLQNKTNTFETDLLYPILDQLAKVAREHDKSIHYKQGKPEVDVALKIVTDHLRCVTFAIGDGITPSNEGRGYIIRMILRRAVRYGRKYLGIQQPFLYQLVSTVRDSYQQSYPELKTQYNTIVETIKLEEARFLETLERGSKKLDDLIDEAKAAKQKQLSGEEVFKLYDTYGFPLELTADIAGESGLTVDEAGFEAAMAQQKTLARGARKNEALVDDQVYSQILARVGASQFTGYDILNAPAKVKALIVNGESVQEVGGTNQPFEAILDQTPFYPESGGQVGDRGAFSREDGHHGLTVVVNDTRKVGDLIVHDCLFDNGGALKVGETLIAQVDPTARQLSATHHTATHLVHAALRKILGDSVTQAGSYVSPEGARFDFTFNRGLKPVEVQRVEFLVNKEILENTARTLELMSVDDAKAAGAIAMFDEKYAEKVRVISYGAFSKELCGGTHVSQLGEIGLVKITSESAIASGVRRIEYVAGEKAYRLFKQVEGELIKSAELLKSPVTEVPQKIERLLSDIKAKEKSIAALEERLAVLDVQTLAQAFEQSKPVLVQYLAGKSTDQLKLIAEKLIASISTYVVLLSGDADSKAHFVCAISPDLNKQGLQAGELVKTAALICDGGGGGKPNFAQAGGKNPAKIGDAMKVVQQQLQEKLSSSVSP